MKAFATGLLKLETRLVPPVDEARMRLVALLRERERRSSPPRVGHPKKTRRTIAPMYGTKRLQTPVEVLQSLGGAPRASR
jgi:hypothetical protein